MLSLGQQLTVGLACEDAWRKAAADKLDAKVAARKRPPHLARKRKALFARLDAGDLSRAEVAAALAKHGDLTFGKRTRFYRVQGVRPYGLKDKIIAQIAEHFGLSARMVKRCWDALRALERDARSV